jgi:peptide/nickel transport system substrate-binding protein
MEGTMRKRMVFGFFILALLMPAFVFATGSTEPAGDTMAAGTDGPQYGGTFTLNAPTFQDPPSPNINDAQHASLEWLEPIQERLIHGAVEDLGPRGSGEYEFKLVAYIPMKYQSGQLISDWEITTDALTWTVRPGVMWQQVDGVMDSRPLTADDLVQDVIRFRESPWGNRFDGMMGEVYAQGNKVVIEYEAYSPEMFYFIGYEDRAIYSPSETEAAGADRWENQGGTGAFKFEEYVVGSYMSYMKNPDYWDTTVIDGTEYEMPFIDRYVRVIFPDEATGLAALRTASVDMYRNPAVSSWGTIESTTTDLEKSTYGDMARVINLKVTEPPFDDLQVRRAMFIGTDIAQFQRFGKAQDFPLHSFPAWPGNPGIYTPISQLPADARELYTYDPEKAMEMLADAGYPNGFEIDFYFDSSSVTDTGFASLLQNQWEKIGVTVNLVGQDYVTYRSYRDTFTYTDTIIAGTQIGNPTGSIINLFKTGGWLNYPQWSNAQLDVLADQIAAELNPETQDALVKQAAVIALQGASQIGTYLEPQAYYWWPWIQNYYGEISIEDGTFGGLVPYIWIDQNLKDSMGF